MIDLYLIPAEEVNKSTIASLANGLIEAVENGNVNALDIHMKAKAVKSAMDEVIKKTEDSVWDEAQRHGGKSFQRFGAMVTISEGSNTPDYTEDFEWQKLSEALKKREEKLKMAFHNAVKGAATIDEETGEQIPVMKAKATKSSIKVTFK